MRDDLIRDAVRAWRDMTGATSAECWRLDRLLRERWGGQRVYISKAPREAPEAPRRTRPAALQNGKLP
jgi:hypothetical protein